LKQVQELAKTELNAAIANEKAAQIEKMAEAEVNVRFLLKSSMCRSLLNFHILISFNL